MVDYGAAIRRPFLDFKKMSIGALMYMVPLVNIVTQFFGSGYILKNAKPAMKGKYGLEAWKDWAEYFVKGIVALVISLIYLIPLAIVSTGVVAVVGLDIIPQLMQGTAPNVGTMGVSVLIGLIVALLTFYVTPVGVLQFIDKDKFGAAFKLGEVFKKAFTGKYLAAWIVAVIYALVVSFVGSFVSGLLAITLVLPWVVLGYVNFIIFMTAVTMLAEAYGEVS